ncbi:MAG: hypothetical protein ABSE76_01010 [Minisyncoccia bacterium]|jgi:hypothetical protein
MNQRLAPLYVTHTIHVPGSRLIFTASCFAGKDWSLSPLQWPNDIAANRPLANKVASALRSIGAVCAFAPNPTEFNAQIIQQGDLDRFLMLGERLYMRRKQDCPADGTNLSMRGHAGIFSAGGCGVIVVSNGYDLVFAHAGRESLLDWRRVKTRGKEEDRHTDVVENVIEAIGGKPKDLHVWPFFFIKPSDFYHRFDDPDPKHAKYNRAAAEYLPHKYGVYAGKIDEHGIYIDLSNIAYAQAVKCGVLGENIHLDYRHMPEGLPHTRNGGGRYLVAIVRQ